MTPQGQQQTIDTHRLAVELARRRRSLGISLEDIAAEVGTNKSTLSRIERDVGLPDADTLVRVIAYLKQPIDSFISSNAGMVVHYEDAPLIEKMAAVLHADPSLSDRGRQALLDLMTAAIEEK